MDPKVTAAIIAVGGAIVSALVAYFVSRRQVDVALGTARIQSQTVFLGKLYEQRLESYPTLYALLGGLGSKIMSGGITVEELKDTWDEIKIWDRENALFLSPYSVKQAISLRKVIVKLINLPDQHLSKNKQKKELLPELIKVQMCLKTELGVMHADDFHNPTQTESLREAVNRLSEENS